MLYLATDLKDTRWLAYIWEEFARINQAAFPIRIVPSHTCPETGERLFYTREPSPGVCIPNRSGRPPGAEVLWLSPQLFVLANTWGGDESFACPYDLFWNAFVFLSRLEEYLGDQKGKKSNSYSGNHPRKDKATFGIPVVNHLFNALEAMIRKHFPGLPFGAGEKPVIEFSHDVDYLQKTFQLRVKQTALNGLNALKAIAHPLEFSRLTKKTLRFLFSNPSYWCFDYWEELEKRYNQHSVFYVYVQTGRKGWKSWLIDPSYNLTADQRLQGRLKSLIRAGFEVGLHGSWHSATDENKLVQEKDLLEKSIGGGVTKIRQHWLRYEESITPRLHNKYFHFDSSLGWNDRLGFRSGCGSRYRPYDHANQRPFSHFITPQVIMDANIFDYGAGQIVSLQRQALQLITDLQDYKNAYISINWHQRVKNEDYAWHELYEKIIASYSTVNRGLNFNILKLPMSSLKDDKLQIVAISPGENHLWQEYVEQHPDATVYHLLAWRSIFEKGLGYRSWYLLAREGREGRVVGCLPLFLVTSPFSRRMVSVPFRDRGGILWSTPAAFDGLLAEAKRLAAEVRARFLQLKTLSPYPPELVKKNGLAEQRYWINSQVDLQALDLDSLWSKIGQKTRNMLRQAEQAQLSLDDMTLSESGLALWYNLHLSSQKRLGLPPFPRKFFQQMLQELRQEKAIKLFSVRKDDEPLAATILLLHRQTAIYGYSSSRSGTQWMRPNDFMLFQVFRWLMAHNYADFDLGSDAPGQKGLLFFKKKWLAQQRAIPTYTFGQAQSWVSDSSDERYAFFRQIISSMPQGLLSLIGSQATKYFG